MNPERVFQLLVASGLVAGGWLYGDYWKKSGGSGTEAGELSELRAQNTELSLKNDEVSGELAQVRSMLSNGPYPIPDDLIAWVEKDYGMVFLRPPSVRLAAPAALRDAAENNLKLIHGEGGLEIENKAWELIGLVPQDQRLLGQWIMIETTGVRGIFDLTKEQILLSETFDPASVPDSSVLARLLAQQLSFQNHPKKEWRNRDEWQAWQATHVGAAASLQARYHRRQAVANDAEFIDPESEREELLLNLSPALQGFANFSFIEGNEYARHFYIQSREAWSQMFQNPATMTSAIIHPDSPPPEPLTLLFEADNGKALGENSVGELGLRLWLEPYLGMEAASEISNEWRGDLYQIKENNQKTSLVWQIELSHESTANSLIKDVEFSMLDHFRETQPNRQIGISAEGRRVIFTNSPKPE